jgi:hypothetical protein
MKPYIRHFSTGPYHALQLPSKQLSAAPVDLADQTQQHQSIPEHNLLFAKKSY